MAHKILFISHSADRTGAPIVFLNFLRWLKDNTNIIFEILLRTGGVLHSDFKAMAPTTIYNPPNFSNRLFYKFIGRLGYRNHGSKRYVQHLLDTYKTSQIDLIYCNSVTNGEILHNLAGLKCPVICHVHELDYWIHNCGPNNFENVKKYTIHYIAVSEAVKINLVQRHGIPNDKIDVVHEFVPSFDKIGAATNTASLRKSLGIPKDVFIVGGSGYETWRKGKDLFIQLAINVFNRSNDLPIYFVWIGGSKKGSDIYQLQHDIRKAGLTDRIFLVPEVSNPLDYFATFDIFAMVSREDPFPLVNLEAASLGKPIICFEQAGGSQEFVEDDAGFVVPYLDLVAMADKVITLVKDKGLRHRLGARAAKKVQERHDISVAAPQLLKIIENLLEIPC
jgi:glycosyltransferase involved in cell wall biosynthesis